MNKFCDKLPYTPFLETKIINSFIEGKIKIDITNPKCYDYWNKYKFILSPEGTGLDCHRTWEAIILDIIPIVKSSPIDEIFKDLPVLIIKDWNELSIDFLNKKYIEIMKNKEDGKYNLNKINLGYWTNIIEQKLYKIPDIMKNNKIHLITYGDNKYDKAKERLCKQAKELNLFDTITSFGKEDLTSNFKNKYKDILNLPRGGGYWIWKLNLLEIMFDRIDDDDFLVYLDAGCHINKFGKKRLIEYFEKFENNDYGILSFQMHNQPEKFLDN